jgi:hypothetical protein
MLLLSLLDLVGVAPFRCAIYSLGPSRAVLPHPHCVTVFDFERHVFSTVD